MIEFKITADSAADFIADLLATASRLTSSSAPVAVAAAPATAEAPKEQPKPRRAPAAKAEEPKAEEPKVEEPKVEEPKAEEPKTTPAPKADGKPLDFDKDVAPLVLGYVKSHGKPWVIEVLEQFGVTRASELPAERLGELVAALNDKAAA